MRTFSSSLRSSLSLCSFRILHSTITNDLPLFASLAHCSKTHALRTPSVTPYSVKPEPEPEPELEPEPEPDPEPEPKQEPKQEPEPEPVTTPSSTTASLTMANETADETTTSSKSLPPHHRAHTDIAGCLFAKEDNRIVPEWIAYHYHVLPMRDLIICEQPDSREFVEDTLHGTRWSPYSEDPLLNITYILAGETFYNKDSDKSYLVSDKYKEDGFPLRIQEACYEYCMKVFKERGKVRIKSKSRTAQRR